MPESKVKTYLEIATNIAVLAVSTLVLGLFAWSYLAQKTAPQIQDGLQKGKALPRLSGVDYSNSPRTLIMALSTRCGYCKESLPFYKQLVVAEHENNKTTRLLAMFPDTKDAVDQYISQNQFKVDTISEVDFRALNIAGTPRVSDDLCKRVSI